MSGGIFDYKDSDLKSEIYGWTNAPSNVFEDREISELVWDVLDLIHDYDWYASGDTCKETYLKAKAEFKKKWFSNRGVRVRRIVDESIEQCKKELYDTFGFYDSKQMAVDGKHTADVVKAKHGEWISVEGDVIFKCSLCDAEVSTSWDYQNDHMFDYCPVCGAKMDGKE